MITARNLEYRAGGTTLLSGVGFDLQAGEVLAVVGPNGAGKSTLLKCLSGEHSPTAGQVDVAGAALSAMSAQAVARWRGVLAQGNPVPFDFRVFEIVLLGRSPHSLGGESAEDHRIAREALIEMDALHLADRTVHTLSGGEMQRIHMARVLAQIWNPVPGFGRLLLLDEPTASLDLHHQHALLQTARDFAKNGTAVMVVLHDLNLASTYADRVLVLKSGRPIATGTPRDVLSPQRIAQVFHVNATLVDHPEHAAPLIFVQPSVNNVSGPEQK